MQDLDDNDRYAMAWQAACFAERRSHAYARRAQRSRLHGRLRALWYRQAAQAARRSAEHVADWRAEPPCYRHWQVMQRRAEMLDHDAAIAAGQPAPGNDDLYGI